MARHSYSIVEYYGEQDKYKCGYCKSPNTNFSHGMSTHILNVQDYQALMDRGWRRCGSYCYKSIMDQTCCPMYTIKCEALNFKISKSQKKMMKRMTKFLKNELRKNDTMEAYDDDYRDTEEIQKIPNHSKHSSKAKKSMFDMNVKFIDDEINARLHPNALDKGEKKCNLEIKQNNSENVPIVSCHDDDSHGTPQSLQSVEMDTTRTPCMKAKFLRKQRKQNKLKEQGKSQEEIEAIFKENKQENQAKGLEEIFDKACNATNRLELKLVRTSPMSSGYINTSKQSYEVYKKYQTTINGVLAEKVTEERYTRFLVKSPLQMKLVRTMSDEFIKTLKVSANLFKKYQMTIHGESEEELDDESFSNFLVKSSLQPWTPDDGPPSGYGSFHEQYWLDNELIAVGVIDILPSCISSVYFFYDPAYSHLSLGTFSSLREIYLTRQLNKVAKDLKYYYMGFYIHSCPKMRYKARMRPSKLLCPETYSWFDIEPCLLKLDKEKYSRLNDDIDAIDEDGIVDIRKVLVLHRQIAMPYEIYKRKAHQTITQEEEDEIKEYASLVGMKCAQRLLLYRSWSLSNSQKN
ncbi:PREDICTED: arginyl-tRNA--protein transferase 1 [Eufriesea mexicana]|uniref:arginyl-tRNA--protein transferase 1 n=1 Tax=Eufriesea mexicana TaxID=516756 RepID=UPI00083BEF3E|nr:PREDICTED: arginyl-tRNA--protein transferase 1 [Eufriesea mexicana]